MSTRTPFAVQEGRFVETSASPRAMEHLEVGCVHGLSWLIASFLDWLSRLHVFPYSAVLVLGAFTGRIAADKFLGGSGWILCIGTIFGGTLTGLVLLLAPPLLVGVSPFDMVSIESLAFGAIAGCIVGVTVQGCLFLVSLYKRTAANTSSVAASSPREESA